MAYRPKDTQERILHRLKITKGHLEKVISMVENDQYCIDVIHQMQAVSAAVRQTEGVVLENHLKTCVADSIRNGNQEESLKEVMEVFKKKNL
jgi:DNA-binding FrmR family transcriptional regulator